MEIMFQKKLNLFHILFMTNMFVSGGSSTYNSQLLHDFLQEEHSRFIAENLCEHQPLLDAVVLLKHWVALRQLNQVPYCLL